MNRNLRVLIVVLITIIGIAETANASWNVVDHANSNLDPCIEFSFQPSGVTANVDKYPLGGAAMVYETTPNECRNLDPGEYIVTLSKAGYNAYTEGVPMYKGKRTIVSGSLTPVSTQKQVSEWFKAGPTVRIQTINDKITKDQSGLVELYLYNPIENNVALNVEILIETPSGVRVYGKDIGETTSGLLLKDFEVTVGETKIVNIRFDSKDGGNFNAKITGRYFPGSNVDGRIPISFEQTFKVESTPVVTRTPTPGPTPIPSYTISATLCDFVPENERPIIGGSVMRNCGKTSFSVSDIQKGYYPLVSVKTDANKPIVMNWEKDGRLLFTYTQKGSSVYSWTNNINNVGRYSVEAIVNENTHKKLWFDVIDPAPVVTYTPRPTPNKGYTTPAEAVGLYSFDNIQVDHTIRLCDINSDRVREETGEGKTKNCGKTTFTLDDHPLDVLPSGGLSGKTSDSEMVYVDVVTSGDMSLIPWRLQPVTMKWYDGSDNRLMYAGSQEVNNIDNSAGSYIGHFSHEINKPGKYYVDVEVVNYGMQRIVFDVIGSHNVVATTVPTPVVTYTARPTPVVTYTARPSPVVTYTATPVVTYVPKPGTLEDPNPGCWSSAFGFGLCAGSVITKTVVGLVVGIGKGVITVFGG